jgi:FeS assembly SUF system regulator
MLRLSKLTDYGMVVMTALARSPQALRNATDLADEAHIGAPTVSKLLKRLGRAGLVESERGAHGGYRLAREPSKIDMAEVIAAIEGPIGLTECSVHNGRCGIQSSCTLRGNWQVINRAVHGALADISLAQMAGSIENLQLRPDTRPRTSSTKAFN